MRSLYGVPVRHIELEWTGRHNVFSHKVLATSEGSGSGEVRFVIETKRDIRERIGSF